jgi:hypothetical protein
MSGAVIPTRSDLPLYQQVTTLDGADYLLTFRYNARDFSWYLDLADQDGAAIVSGIHLVEGWDLLRRCVDPRRPPGLLMANDVTGAGGEAGPNDLGTRVELLYFTAAEVAEGRAALGL